MSDDYVVKNPTADPSATEVVINVLYAAELLAARMDRFLQRHELSRGGFNLLQIVHGAPGPMSPTEIGERLLVTTATVTGVLDTLQRGNLITRTPDAIDRRRVLIAITPAGIALLDEIGAELIEREKVWAEPLTPAERERLTRDLGKIQAHLRSLSPEP